MSLTVTPCPLRGMRPRDADPDAMCAAPAPARPASGAELLAAVLVIAAGGACIVACATAVAFAVLWASATPWAASSAAVAAAAAAGVANKELYSSTAAHGA